MKKRCSKIENVDRIAVVDSAQRANSGLSFTSQAAADSEMIGYVVEETTIKAALLVLINHGMVTVTKVGASFEYKALKKAGMRLARYDRYCQHVKGCYEELTLVEFDEKKRLPGIIVKAVLCKGMMRTEEIVDYCAEQVLIERCREEKKELEEMEEVRVGARSSKERMARVGAGHAHSTYNGDSLRSLAVAFPSLTPLVVGRDGENPHQQQEGVRQGAGGPGRLAHHSRCPDVRPRAWWGWGR